MSFSDEELREIFDSNHGRCCYCKKKLVFSNYGMSNFGKRGNWEKAHILPVRWGFKDTIPILGWNNYLPACHSCNQKDRKGRLWLAKLGRWFFSGTRAESHFGVWDREEGWKW